MRAEAGPAAAAARRLDHAADQGHEPGVHRQGRLLHRHQAGAARHRDRGGRGRAARHPGLAGRGAVPGTRRWTRRGGCWPTARTTTRITGIESDQVYLDLLGGWREAWQRGCAARRDAVAAYLAAGRVPPRQPGAGHGAWPGVQRAGAGAGARWPRSRSGPGRPRHPVAGDPRRGAGQPVPGLAEGVQRREDGSLAEVTLTFRGPRRARPRRPRPTRRCRPRTGGAGLRRGRTSPGRARYADRERRVPGHRRSGPGRDGDRHRQAHRRQRARRARQRAGRPGRVRAAPQARRRARGTCRPRGRAPGRRRSRPRCAAQRCPVGSPAGGLVHARRARRHPGDPAVGRRRARRVPHPRRRLPRAATGCCGSGSPPTCPAGCRCTRRRRR